MCAATELDFTLLLNKVSFLYLLEYSISSLFIKVLMKAALSKANSPLSINLCKVLPYLCR